MAATDETPAVEPTPAQHIDAMIAAHADWRGAVLADARAAVLAVDPAIEETWKWRGAPVWELDGILVVGNVFRTAVKLGFMYGAALEDPDGLFNDELGGNQRRAIKYSEGGRRRRPGTAGARATGDRPQPRATPGQPTPLTDRRR
ncbi:DUF1801 domain-containing protein [Curtobacterium sp. MCJR17_043]|uniref:DUF1801 domain-containing protein n=1 Tax=Curtobacterium sp. MCJR17_043 TaxID=2175660 RepID=UPI0024DF7431|nr:DUF1801 domain-containing protein [Curtobacterium sp. MCJR17_043]WIB35603.1 DUF1801 domain-containing protein [Curtobacterium sp. MCJR17_043]